MRHDGQMNCCGGDILERKANGPLVLVVAAALVNEAGEVLICQRPPGKAMAGLWEFPGGKVAAGETPEGALVRELEEELGIAVFTGCLLPITFASHAYEASHLLMPLYLIRQWQGEIVLREHTALAWVRPEAMRDYPMPAADVPLIPPLFEALR
jgi:8-oxo-dGTP diphosphatase